jgi:adenosylhomocysteine nucleosidase
LTGEVVGVVCALRSEARHFSRTLTRNAPLETLADGRLLAVTGIGYACAAAGAQRLIDGGAGALVSFGMAGGLDPQLPAGLVFLPAEVVGPDGTLLPTDQPWRAALGTALGTARAVSGGRLLTVDTAVASVAAKRRLWMSSGARAVDMESAAVAAAAAAHALPFLAVRAIVDRAADELPAVVMAASGPGGKLAFGRLLRGLLRAPAQLGPLWALAGGYRAANRALAAVAASAPLVRRPH